MSTMQELIENDVESGNGSLNKKGQSGVVVNAWEEYFQTVSSQGQRSQANPHSTSQKVQQVFMEMEAVALVKNMKDAVKHGVVAMVEAVSSYVENRGHKYSEADAMKLAEIIGKQIGRTMPLSWQVGRQNLIPVFVGNSDGVLSLYLDSSDTPAASFHIGAKTH